METSTPEEKLLNLIKQSQGRPRLKKRLKLFTRVNIILICLIVAILAIFIVDLFIYDRTIPELAVDLPTQETQVKPVEGTDVEVSEDLASIEKAHFSVEEIVKDLSLLGIIAGENNQAIIEDKKANKTFFLNKGESFKEFTVDDIKDNQVILDYKGEKIRLTM